MNDPETLAWVEEWLTFAEEDLTAATRFSDLPRISAFHAQQAVKKAIKAVLTCSGIEFPKTHNLVELRDLLADSAWLEAGTEALQMVTRWSTNERYPGRAADPSSGDAMQAVRIATILVPAARSRVANLSQES